MCTVQATVTICTCSYDKMHQIPVMTDSLHAEDPTINLPTNQYVR